MSQATRCQLAAVEAQIRVQDSPCEVCGVVSDTEETLLQFQQTCYTISVTQKHVVDIETPSVLTEES
jgi:hypothetical protein